MVGVPDQSLVSKHGGSPASLINDVAGTKPRKANSNSASPIISDDRQNENQSNVAGSVQSNDASTIKPTRLP